ncbi:Cys-tRNA(Pro) deacylase [Alteromonas sp. H39]|uniref:Cys-tRNA(Pro) deacylase n=1 Tax=Alteromonas sp. H39 TaxID=3389876 RepID=UPI0039E1841A
MTPAVTLLNKRRVTFELLEYHHDASCQAFGMEAVEKLSLPASQVFKTLVTELDNGSLAVALIPVTARLSLKKMAKACGVKKATMADPAKVTAATGYIMGGVSPLGQKKQLTTVIDVSAVGYTVCYVSGGRRGLEIAISPQDLMSLSKAKAAPVTET